MQWFVIIKSLKNHELQYYGYEGTTYKWIKSYISDRKQIMRSNGEQSHRKDILWDIPQA